MSLLAREEDKRLEELFSFRPKWWHVLNFLKEKDVNLFNEYYDLFMEEFVDD